MSNIILLATRDGRQDREPVDAARPVMTWVIDASTGRPVMAWSLPASEVETILRKVA